VSQAIQGVVTAAILSAIAAVAFPVPVRAGESADPPATVAPGPELESVTVEARRRQERISKEVSAFVSAIVASPMHESLGRWAVAVCPFTAGLAPAAGDFVRKRVADVATASGVALGPPDCAPNFLIVVTPEPEQFLRDWWKADHRLFNKERGVGSVERFIETDQPVRVWHNACSAPPALARNFRLNVTWDCNTGTPGSRLSFAAVRSIYLAIVMVDLTPIEGLTFGQVADYVAMVGLAQVQSSPEIGATPSILNLFADDGADKPKGLTDWDQSFLKAVYETRRGNVTELSQVKMRMGRDLAH
jgi:hypothetical protein